VRYPWPLFYGRIKEPSTAIGLEEHRDNHGR
jgi:hypothetical protein